MRQVHFANLYDSLASFGPEARSEFVHIELHGLEELDVSIVWQNQDGGDSKLRG